MDPNCAGPALLTMIARKKPAPCNTAAEKPLADSTTTPSNTTLPITYGVVVSFRDVRIRQPVGLAPIPVRLRPGVPGAIYARA